MLSPHAHVHPHWPALHWLGHGSNHTKPWLTSESPPSLPNLKDSPLPWHGPAWEPEEPEPGWTASRCPSHRAAPRDSWDRPSVSLPIPGQPQDGSGCLGPEARRECAALGDRDRGTDSAIPGWAPPPISPKSLSAQGRQPPPTALTSQYESPPGIPRTLKTLTQDKPRPEWLKSNHVWGAPQAPGPVCGVPGASSLVHGDLSGYSSLSDPGPQHRSSSGTWTLPAKLPPRPVPGPQFRILEAEHTPLLWLLGCTPTHPSWPPGGEKALSHPGEPTAEACTRARVCPCV